MLLRTSIPNQWCVGNTTHSIPVWSGYSYFVLDEQSPPKFTSFPQQNYHKIPNKMVVNGGCGYLRPINQSEIGFIWQTDSLSRYLLRSL